MSSTHGRGYVLWRQERGETDLAATLLLDDGRLARVVAKGAARSTRRFSAGLSPFTLYRFVFGRTLTAGLRLDEASVERIYPAVLADLRRTAAAGVAAAVLRDLGGEVAHDAGHFHLYAALVAELERADAQGSGGALVRFVFEALDRAGLSFVLDACTRCGRAAPDNALVHVSAEAGGVVCVACGGAPLTLRAADRRALRAVLAGQYAAFTPVMLHWTARLLAPHARRGGEALERASPHWSG